MLTGINTLCIHDDNTFTPLDAGVNFCVNPSSINTHTRSQICLPQFKELNPQVNVTIHSGTIDPSSITEFDLIIATDHTLTPDNELILANSVRQSPRKQGFITASSLGLSFMLYTDFGLNHTILDPSFEPQAEYPIQNITNSGRTIVQMAGHSFTPGDRCQFRHVEGMIEINDCIATVTQVPSAGFIEIDLDTSKFGQYKANGLGILYVEPAKISFTSYPESLKIPLPKSDKKSVINLHYSDPKDRLHQLHLANLAMIQFHKAQSQLPKLKEPQDAELFYQLAGNINRDLKLVDTLDRTLIDRFSLYARTQFAPLATLFGAIVAQEAFKFFGKGRPTTNWLYYDIYKLLDGIPPTLPTSLRDSRYDNQIILFGDSLQRTLAEQNVLLVGAGAIGVEYLKLLSQMGVSCSPSGLLTVVDDDYIEESNLNRQFLVSSIRPQKVESICQR